MLARTMLLFVTTFFTLAIAEKNVDDSVTNHFNEQVIKKEFNKRVISIDPTEIYNEIEVKKSEPLGCQQFETLNLDRMNFGAVKADIIHSNNINQISLEHNSLRDIPRDMLKHVQYLSCLNLAYNRINIYQENPIEHYSLRILNITYQKMLKVVLSNELMENSEEEVMNIDKLLYFNNTKMFLPKLEHLDLSGNTISSLLSSFKDSFPRLRYLYLIDINAADIDPLFFSKIPATLSDLHFEKNYLQNLTITNMPGVISLYLDRNPIKYISIVDQELQVLSLVNCTLENAEVDLQTPDLEQLDLSANNLQYVPDELFGYMNSLHTLLLNRNRISQIPAFTAIKQLSKLSLNYNRIKYIPAHGFAHLPYLKRLSLKGNQLERIEKDSFLNLMMLESLDLSENQLTSLPYSWVSPLTNLRSLNMNSNHFATVADMSIGTSAISLRHLFIRNNTFKRVTLSELEALPNFITVYLI